jgi:ABC-type transport system involved in multi-copper enzyme maturation permease subunit
VIWTTWRQHRTELLITGTVLLLVLLILLMTGITIAGESSRTGFAACLARQADCSLSPAQSAVENFIQNQAFGNSTFYTLFQLALLALPLAVGMFVGAHMVAREYEEGTYRLAWTQSISRSRWLLVKVALLMGLLLVASGVLCAAFSWWKIPVVAATSGLWGSTNYDVWSIVAIPYTLFSLMLGICTGTLVRKTVPAMAITLVVFVILRVVIEVFWRSYFLPPLVMTIPVNSTIAPPPQALVLSDTQEILDRRGNQTSLPSSVKDSCSAQISRDETPQEVSDTYNQCLAMHGFQFVTVVVYQPPDRFWLFQAIESGIYLCLTAFLFALTFWWVKYRFI